MKKIVLLSFLLSALFISSALRSQVKNTEVNINASKRQINKTIAKWHKAAAAARFDDYFELMTADAIFIGTDATENWKLPEFKEFSRPYFDAGKAWSFSTLERNLYVHANTRVAWFDELLDTHMGICRGSGVVIKENGKWKISHYVLSISIPNENVEEITKLKKEFDQKLVTELKKNKN